MDSKRVLSPRSVYATKLRDFPDLVFSDQAVFHHRGKWREFFSRRIGPAFDGRIILEIGCFDAGYLSTIATKHPTTGFLGIDWKCKPLWDGANRVTKLGIGNVALLRGRGQDLTNIFAEGEVDEIWLFHPDPFDRPVESGQRLVSEKFLVDVHNVLRDIGSRFCFKTDHPGYYDSVIGHFSAPGESPAQSPNDSPKAETVRACFEISVNSRDYWHDPFAQSHTAGHYFAREVTLFENRFIKRRLPIYFIEMRKKNL